MNWVKLNNKKLINYTFIIIQLIIIAALLIDKKFSYVNEVLFVTVILVIYIFLENKYGIYVGNYTRVCLMLVVIMHGFAGKYLNLYLESSKFDNYLHVFGIYSVTLFVYSIVSNLLIISFMSKSSKFLYITLLGISIGTIFEIIEFIVDITINPNIHNQPSLVDTDLDLIADAIGALIAAFHVCFIDVLNKK